MANVDGSLNIHTKENDRKFQEYPRISSVVGSSSVLDDPIAVLTLTVGAVIQGPEGFIDSPNELTDNDLRP